MDGGNDFAATGADDGDNIGRYLMDGGNDFAATGADDGDNVRRDVNERTCDLEVN